MELKCATELPCGSSWRKTTVQAYIDSFGAYIIVVSLCVYFEHVRPSLLHGSVKGVRGVKSFREVCGTEENGLVREG
jgi:hypothetical protein